MIIAIGVILLIVVGYFLFKGSRSEGRSKKVSVYENKSQTHKKHIKTSVEMSKELGRNSWLYPEDDFGKMEEGKSNVELKYSPKKIKEDDN